MQFIIHNYEPVHDKTNKMMCAQWILRSNWASAQSDQSFRYPCEESLGPWLPFERTAKTLIRLGWCLGWSESSLGVQVILLVLSCSGSYMSHVTTKSAFGVCDQLRFKPACSATETTLGLEILYYPDSKQQKRWSYCADVHADPVFEISSSPTLASHAVVGLAYSHFREVAFICFSKSDISRECEINSDW